jgi:hypothetical protein
VIAVLRRIWEEYDYRCGSDLRSAAPGPQIRLIIDFLGQYDIFGPFITPAIKAKLLTISLSAIDRRLNADWKKLALKGRGFSKPGTLLRYQIPIRA